MSDVVFRKTSNIGYTHGNVGGTMSFADQITARRGTLTFATLTDLAQHYADDDDPVYSMLEDSDSQGNDSDKD